jgi:cellulose biosynthesis protein BcsQ
MVKRVKRARLKKPTVRSLQEELRAAHQMINDLQSREFTQRARAEELERQRMVRVDTTMIQERIKLANALGQMIEATSKAVMFIIAKEAV